MHKRYSRCKSEDHHVVEPSFIDELHVATFSAFWCHYPHPYCFLEYPEIGVYRGREGSGCTKYAFIPPPTYFRSCHYALAVFVISNCLRVPVSSNRHHLLSDLLTIPSLLSSQPASSHSLGIGRFRRFLGDIWAIPSGSGARSCFGAA
jgi:hypothetical protein